MVTEGWPCAGLFQFISDNDVTNGAQGKQLDEPAYARERAVICQAVIDILRVYCLNYFAHDRIGEKVEELLIGFALYVGQEQGRPLSATDIAEYLGMSRTTVARKLQHFEKAGILHVETSGRRLQYRVRVATSPIAISRMGKLIDRTKASLNTLTKMDDTGLD